MTMRDDDRREEYEADFPRCRAHRVRGCETCEELADDEHDREILSVRLISP